MESNQSLRDLQWLLHSIQTESLYLKRIYFHLSQPTSCCHQQTQDSIHINISGDAHFQFSDILTLLATSLKTQIFLQNLEFYQVEWRLEEVKSLEVLLDGCSNVKQLVFKMNTFNADSMAGLAKILKKNEAIKEIMLSESRIGSYGATVMASALKVNSCLVELQIWEDSIGSKGAEELSKMIEANSTLKLLIIFDSSSITATPLISAVLARNRPMEVHVWSSEHGKNNSSKVVDELESLPSGTYCVWRPKAEDGGSSPLMTKCKKSKSTGSGSRRWRIRYLLRRSNSEGKEPVVLLTHKKVDSPKQKRNSGEVSKVVGLLKAQTPIHEQFYVQRRAENEVGKRKSYLPYMQDLVGFFTNVNGMGKMLPF